MKRSRQRWLIAGALLLLVCTARQVWAQGIDASPNPVDYGMVYIASHTDRTVTIQNTGGGDVMVTNLQLQNMYLVAYTFESPLPCRTCSDPERA